MADLAGNMTFVLGGLSLHDFVDADGHVLPRVDVPKEQGRGDAFELLAGCALVERVEAGDAVEVDRAGDAHAVTAHNGAPFDLRRYTAYLPSSFLRTATLKPLFKPMRFTVS